MQSQLMHACWLPLLRMYCQYHVAVDALAGLRQYNQHTQ
jgi:hypothetical protein